MNNQQDNSDKQQHTDHIIVDEGSREIIVDEDRGDTISDADSRDRKPNPAVVRLSFKTEEGDGKGTGFLVNEITIITAAHNIHPTTQLSNREAEILKSISYGAPSTTKSGPNPRDLALIILKPPGILLDRGSYIKLAEGMQNEQCLVTGYDKFHNYVKGDEGLATKSDDDLYAYQMDTVGGQSGGPLLLSGTQQAIGVHIFGIPDKSNFAAPITAEFINWVRKKSPA